MTKSNNKKPLVITEGKTDWQHLKKALERFQYDDIYTNLNIEFEEYIDTGAGESVLDSRLKSRAKSENDRVHIYIFDRDTPSYGKNSFTKILDEDYKKRLKDKLKKYYGCDSSKTYKTVENNLDNGLYKEIDSEIKKALTGEDYEEWERVSNNKVYVFCIPEIKNSDSPRTLDSICIEFYYKETDLKTTNKEGQRLFFADEFEFKEKNCFISQCGKFKTKLREIKSGATKELTLISSGTKTKSNNVYGVNDREYKNPLLLSKNNFTKYIVNEVRGFSNFDIENFRLIFDVIEKIVKDETIGYLDLRNIQLNTHGNFSSKDEESINILIEFIPFTKLLGYVNSLPTSINLEFLGIDDTLDNFKLDLPHYYPFDDEELNNIFSDFLQSYINLTYTINGFYKDKPVYGQVPDGYIERGIHVIFFNKNEFTSDDKNELITNIEERKVEFINSYNSLMLFIRKKYKNVKLDSYKYQSLSITYPDE